MKSDAAVALATYLCAFGNPDEVLPLLKDIDSEPERLEVEVDYYKAKCQYPKALAATERLDSLYWERIELEEQAQVAMANAAYNNQLLEAQKHELVMADIHHRLQRNMLGVLVVIVLLILMSLGWYHRGILKKNRELVQRIRAQEEAETENVQLTLAQPENMLSAEQRMFARISELLSDEKVLANQDLNRDEIAAMLGTNRTYVAQAIAECADGMSVSEYVGKLRIQMARRLMETMPDMSLEDISEASGFASRSRFHTLFCKYYNMTPGQFRKASR